MQEQRNARPAGRAHLRTASAAVMIGVAVALTLAATGCGKTTIKQSDEVALVNKQLASQNLKAKTVDCPSDVEAKEGTTFQCNVTLTNGKTGTYDIKVQNVSGSNASLQITGAHSTGKGG